MRFYQKKDRRFERFGLKAKEQDEEPWVIITEVALLDKIMAKESNDWKTRFFLRQASSKREFLCVYNILELLSTVFSQVKNPDGSNVIGEDCAEDLDVHKSHKGWTYVLTHFGTGDRGGLFLMADMTASAQGLYELQASGYH